MIGDVNVATITAAVAVVAAIVAVVVSIVDIAIVAIVAVAAAVVFVAVLLIKGICRRDTVILCGDGARSQPFWSRGNRAVFWMG